MKRTLIALFALLIAVATFAQPRPGRGPRAGAGADGPGGPRGMRGHDGDGPRGRGPGAERLAEILDLSDAQKAQAKELRVGVESTIEPLREQQKANHDAIRAAVDAGNATAAGTAMIANDKLRDQIKAAHEAFKTSFEAILTADQKTKFAILQEMREQRRPHRD